MAAKRGAHFEIKFIQWHIAVTVPALGQFMIATQIDNDSAITPEGLWKPGSQFRDAGLRISKSVDMPVQHDARLNFFFKISQCMPATNKITQHRTQPETFIFTGQQEMS